MGIFDRPRVSVARKEPMTLNIQIDNFYVVPQSKVISSDKNSFTEPTSESTNVVDLRDYFEKVKQKNMRDSSKKNEPAAIFNIKTGERMTLEDVVRYFISEMEGN